MNNVGLLELHTLMAGQIKVPQNMILSPIHHGCWLVGTSLCLTLVMERDLHFIGPSALGKS